MDWVRDNAGVNDNDLHNVFKYEEKPTTVVRVLAGFKRPEIWSLEGEKEWDDWIDNDCPHIDGPARGLVLILAKRTGELAIRGVKKEQSNVWLQRIDEEMPQRRSTQVAFASLTEKSQALVIRGGRRSVRTLPFSQRTFRLVANKFYTHRSIARDISRADVPVFYSAKVQMGEPAHPAYVYNCRSTNAWDMDLALTATYFPHCGLTYAIIFGCPLSVEEEIVKRLSFAMAEAAHPLLISGIFAEIERSRHVHIVEATINELESRIFELDFQSDRESMPLSEVEKRNQEKRSAWLDTTYLRNVLVSWNTQVSKMSNHADELKDTIFGSKVSSHVDRLNDTIFGPNKSEETVLVTKNIFEDNSSNVSANEFKLGESILSSQFGLPGKFYENGADGRRRDHAGNWKECESASRNVDDEKIQRDSEATKEHMRTVGDKIKDRMQAIIEEYDDKIRDCTMRIDGMAMATQWAHGETNVEIALATSRESKHMRSIAIVTMIFLPGTFFASVFSMTFFNWTSSDSIISSYIWIYVVVTVFFTLLTIGTWWYFVIYRPSRSRKVADDEQALLA